MSLQSIVILIASLPLIVACICRANAMTDGLKPQAPVLSILLNLVLLISAGWAGIKGGLLGPPGPLHWAALVLGWTWVLATPAGDAADARQSVGDMPWTSPTSPSTPGGPVRICTDADTAESEAAGERPYFKTLARRLRREARDAAALADACMRGCWRLPPPPMHVEPLTPFL